LSNIDENPFPEKVMREEPKTSKELGLIDICEKEASSMAYTIPLHVHEMSKNSAARRVFGVT
jgi:hypothetical protein